MSNLKKKLPVLLLAAFELLVGILLFVYAEQFVQYLMMGFGIAIVIFGVLQLISYLKGRKDNTSNAFLLTSAVVTMLLGVVCTMFATKIVELIGGTALAIFGIMLIITGIYKIGIYFDIKKLMPITFMPVLSGVAAIICGALILFLASVNDLIVFIGVVHIAVAVFDIVAVLLTAKKKDTLKEHPTEKDTDEE